MQKSKITSLVAVTLLALAVRTFAQVTNLQIVEVKLTEERAPLIKWQSESNQVYRVEFTSEVTNANTQWQPLYEEYPSHGTNTFIADAGNYDLAPAIPHPRLLPMRFYRIALVGTNTSPSNPLVAVTFPTNGASLSGDVTMAVTSSSSESITEVKLYIDGEEQWRSDDGTTFLINTCEWPNGPHTIFATAKSQSGIEGIPHNNPITYGRSVSSYINVTFDNLITKVDLAEPFLSRQKARLRK